MADTPKFQLIKVEEEEIFANTLTITDMFYYEFLSLQEDRVSITVEVNRSNFKTKEELIDWIKKELLRKYEIELRRREKQIEEAKQKEIFRLELGIIF